MVRPVASYSLPSRHGCSRSPARQSSCSRCAARCRCRRADSCSGRRQAASHSSRFGSPYARHSNGSSTWANAPGQSRSAAAAHIAPPCSNGSRNRRRRAIARQPCSIRTAAHNPARTASKPFSTLDAFAAHVRANTIPEVWIALPITETSAIVRMLDTLRHDLVDAQLFDLSDSSVRDRCGGQARRATRRSPHVGGYRRHVHRAGRGLPVRLRLSCLDRAADADGAEPEIPACTRHGRAVGVMAGRRWHAP
ncbi:hypothetical protein E9536_31110 [Burkholderia sp. LS-044]|nr:hypothetical protein E9536_31110 [Burkholderia sp. LS-044]